MSRSTRILLVILLGGFALGAAGAVAIAAAVQRSGSIAIGVHDQDSDVNVAVPVEPLAPALKAGWRQLERAQDFVLVEVEGQDDSLRIEKRGGRLLVRGSDSHGSRVDVAIPLRTVGLLLSKFES